MNLSCNAEADTQWVTHFVGILSEMTVPLYAYGNVVLQAKPQGYLTLQVDLTVFIGLR